jgi:hypothetical protein
MEKQDPGARDLLATVLSSTATYPLGLNPLPKEAPVNWVTFDLRQPRSHFSQVWSVTYEGILPWFSGRRGRLSCSDPSRMAIDCEQGDSPATLRLDDSSVGFCDGGAQGEDIAPIDSDMVPAGDILEIIDNLPDPTDPYWVSDTAKDVCTRAECEEVFGTLEAPRILDQGRPIGRDIVIAKSYQDHLSLKPSVARRGDNKPIPVACCFPYPLSYTIRGGRQWIVTGQASGFAHHLVSGESKSDTGTERPCVQSRDPNMALRNGRVLARSVPADGMPEVPNYDDPVDEKRLDYFRNAQLRFVIWDVEGTTCRQQPCAGRVRDRFFSFQESGGFIPMRFGLSSSQFVLPQSVRYVPGLQMLAIPDPVTMGLMLFDLNRLATIVSFY